MVESVEKCLLYKCLVGVGILGIVFCCINIVKNVNLIWLNGKLFLLDLEVVLNRDIWIVNDVNCFILFEVMDGVGVGYFFVFGVILGIGCGVGYVVNGGIIDGLN